MHDLEGRRAGQLAGRRVVAIAELARADSEQRVVDGEVGREAPGLQARGHVLPRHLALRLQAGVDPSAREEDDERDRRPDSERPRRDRPDATPVDEDLPEQPGAEAHECAAGEREHDRDRDHADHRHRQGPPDTRLAEQPERERERRREHEGDVVRIALRQAREERGTRKELSDGEEASDRRGDRERPDDLPLEPVVADELADDEEQCDEARVAGCRRDGVARRLGLHRRHQGEGEDREHDAVCPVEDDASAGDERVQGEADEGDRADGFRRCDLRVRPVREGELQRPRGHERQHRHLDLDEADRGYQDGDEPEEGVEGPD